MAGCVLSNCCWSTAEADRAEGHRGPLEALHGRIGGSVGNGFAFIGGVFISTVAVIAIVRRITTTTTKQTDTTMATAKQSATTMATAKQSATTMATTKQSATTMATAKQSAATVTSITAVTTMACLGCIFTAKQCDSDEREENRDTENNCTIHPNILQTKKVN